MNKIETEQIHVEQGMERNEKLIYNIVRNTHLI
jgi:hypothetical protein